MFTEQEMKEYGLAPNELKHYGVVGMKWGVRKYQNEDGTLTASGKARYARSPEGIGYTPLKGKRGDFVQRGLAKSYLESKKVGEAYKKRAAKNGSQKALEKAAKYLKTAEFRKAMLKTYTNMGPADRKSIRNGYIKADVLATAMAIPLTLITGNPAVASLVSGLSWYAVSGFTTNRIAKETEIRNRTK